MGELTTRALEKANSLEFTPLGENYLSSRSDWRKRVAVGDPQTTADRFFELLEKKKLLNDDGLLKEDASLVSIGDHFDFQAGGDTLDAGREGMRLLRWLAEHPANQVSILLGNHDVCRVMELHAVSDEEFAEARSLADRIGTRCDPDLLATFHEQFPAIPTPDLVIRDFSSFSVAQRVLVRSLLVKQRMVLAKADTYRGRKVLLTHAGITQRELNVLRIPEERDPEVIAAALNKHLADSVQRWQELGDGPLDLPGLHFPGVMGIEGGGMLYHRPGNPESPLPRGQHPARFLDIRTLPTGLLQVCGHTTHEKLRKRLAGWPACREGEAMKAEHVRCLEWDSLSGRANYFRACGDPLPPLPETALIMIDGNMNGAEDLASYELLDLGT